MQQKKIYFLWKKEYRPYFCILEVFYSLMSVSVSSISGARPEFGKITAWNIAEETYDSMITQSDMMTILKRQKYLLFDWCINWAWQHVLLIKYALDMCSWEYNMSLKGLEAQLQFSAWTGSLAFLPDLHWKYVRHFLSIWCHLCPCLHLPLLMLLELSCKPKHLFTRPALHCVLGLWGLTKVSECRAVLWPNGFSAYADAAVAAVLLTFLCCVAYVDHSPNNPLNHSGRRGRRRKQQNWKKIRQTDWIIADDNVVKVSERSCVKCASSSAQITIDLNVCM